MTYTAAAAIGVVGALAVDCAVFRTRLVTRAVWWTSYAIVLGFQLVANGILTGRRIVIYRESAIVGFRVAYAPVEDVLFGFALVLLTLSTWVWLGRRGVQRSPHAGSRPAGEHRTRETGRSDAGAP